jgi:hypothetical protein
MGNCEKIGRNKSGFWKESDESSVITIAVDGHNQYNTGSYRLFSEQEKLSESDFRHNNLV